MTEETVKEKTPVIDRMFAAGAHFGFGKSRRHPSAKSYIFGSKNRTEIFDLEKTSELLEKAKFGISSFGKEGKTVLFVSGKNEAKEAVKSAAESLGMPYVAGRWIGGTITNFSIIRSRVEKYLELVSAREKGELAKYTKKERLLIDREIDRLQNLFGGLVLLTKKPDALFVIDAKQEYTAVNEARRMGIPVVALLSSDGDSSRVTYPVFGNDSAKKSIEFFVNEMKEAYEEGKKAQKIA
ncbi:MAG: 30S ribosomal protein S2 [bacterium]|nr:30S ribosomal protein S2 [bacterium]